MNRNRIMVVVGIALLLAVLASVGVYKFLSGQSRVAEQARLQTVGIVVALVDIPIGSTINSNQVAVSPWPKDSYPKDAIADPKGVVGRVALRDFTRGEPVVESKLVPLNKSTGLLSLKIPSGMRGFSVKVNEVVGVGGFIVPDSRVDVILTTSPRINRRKRSPRLSLKMCSVLAAGKVIEQKDNKPVTVNTVTLALHPGGFGEACPRQQRRDHPARDAELLRQRAGIDRRVQQRAPPFVVPERAPRAGDILRQGDETPACLQENVVASRRFRAPAEKCLLRGSHQGEQADGRENRLNVQEKNFPQGVRSA